MKLMSRPALIFLVSTVLICVSACEKIESMENPVEAVHSNETLANKNSSVKNNNENNNETWNYPITQLPSNLRLVTDKMGGLKVQVGKFAYESDKQSRPWSGWWFPAKETNLFINENSPLRKYDRFVENRKGVVSQVADRYKNKSDATEALPWEGLCDAWSLASVYEIEPKEYLMVDDICLSPGDQKALLTVAYKDSGGHLKDNFFGQLNTKGPQSIYNDIYPDQLHRLIQAELGDRSSPFLMDFDAGESIWTVPVYKAELTITNSKISKDTLDVELILTSPEFQFTPEQKVLNDQGRLGNIFNKRKYTYSLLGHWEENEFIVTKGVWTGTSEIHHPDYVISLAASIDANSHKVDTNKVSYDLVQEFFGLGTVVPNCNK